MIFAGHAPIVSVTSGKMRMACKALRSTIAALKSGSERRLRLEPFEHSTVPTPNLVIPGLWGLVNVFNVVRNKFL